MKTKEQIELAQHLVTQLQDYVELAKVEKKIKNEENSKPICSQLENITLNVFENVEKL